MSWRGIRPRSAAKQINENTADAVGKVALELLNDLVLGTPVDTGRARGNWQLSIGSPRTSALDRTDKNGQGTIGKAEAELESMRELRVIYITNNLPYIEPLMNGHSRQAPSGWVDAAVAKADAKLK